MEHIGEDEQDECGISPQLILSNLIHVSSIIEPQSEYLTLSQVTHCAKCVRKLKGTKNPVHAVNQLMRNNTFISPVISTMFFSLGDEKLDILTLEKIPTKIRS
ncbi:hypothetical protein GQ600_18125 [Phytophthora cactorum]|nr:hypothetical protein GQ600_18125 [Phytophthora cactorum]